MSKLNEVILRDVLASRPAFGIAGRLFYDTTNGILYRDSGAAWESMEWLYPATLPAASGVNLTNLNATQLTSGTVPLARLSGITNTQIDAAAAIVDTKLATISTAGKVATSAIATGTISTAITHSAALNIRKASSASNNTVLNFQQSSDTTYGFRWAIDDVTSGDAFFYAVNASVEGLAWRVGRSTPNVAIPNRVAIGTSTPPTSGAQLQSTSFSVNGGTTILGHISATFAGEVYSNGGGGTISTNTFTVTGAALGDTVDATPYDYDDGGEVHYVADASFVWSAFVSASNTVVVRQISDTGSGTADSLFSWRIDVWKH